MIYAPAASYDVIMKMIMTTQNCDLEQHTCHNTTASSFPVLEFSFNQYPKSYGKEKITTLKLLPEYYTECVNGECVINILNHGYVLYGYEKKRKLMKMVVCRDIGDDLYWWVLGDSFLHAYYTIFDYEHLQLGFACDAEKAYCDME